MPKTEKSNSGRLTITATTFSRLAGVIFFLVAIVQLKRLTQGWVITVDGQQIPLWVSGIMFVVALSLGYLGSTARPDGKG